MERRRDAVNILQEGNAKKKKKHGVRIRRAGVVPTKRRLGQEQTGTSRALTVPPSKARERQAGEQKARHTHAGSQKVCKQGGRAGVAATAATFMSNPKQPSSRLPVAVPSTGSLRLSRAFTTPSDSRCCNASWSWPAAGEEERICCTPEKDQKKKQAGRACSECVSSAESLAARSDLSRQQGISTKRQRMRSRRVW